jgi:hypothetical protein
MDAAQSDIPDVCQAHSFLAGPGLECGSLLPPSFLLAFQGGSKLPHSKDFVFNKK